MELLGRLAATAEVLDVVLASWVGSSHSLLYDVMGVRSEVLDVVLASRVGSSHSLLYDVMGVRSEANMMVECY